MSMSISYDEAAYYILRDAALDLMELGHYAAAAVIFEASDACLDEMDPDMALAIKMQRLEVSQ